MKRIRIPASVVIFCILMFILSFSILFFQGCKVRFLEREIERETEREMFMVHITLETEALNEAMKIIYGESDDTVSLSLKNERVLKSWKNIKKNVLYEND